MAERLNDLSSNGNTSTTITKTTTPTSTTTSTTNHKAHQNKSNTRLRDRKQSSSAGAAATVMQQRTALAKPRVDRRGDSRTTTTRTGTRTRRIFHKLGKRTGLINYEKRGSSESSQSRGGGSSNGSGGGGGNGYNNNWADMEYSERQNSVGTFDLFRYAKLGELTAIITGIVFMIYAASWQPISVFILAIMASLMGQYSKQASLLKNLNGSAALHGHGQGHGQDEHATATTTIAATTTTDAGTITPGPQALQPGANNSVGLVVGSPIASSPSIASKEALAFLANSFEYFTRARANWSADSISNDDDGGDGVVEAAPAEPSLFNGPSWRTSTAAAAAAAASSSSSSSSSSPYDEYSFLHLLHSFVTPIFDFGAGASGRLDEENSLKAAVHVILERESTQFLRKSFEINGSAFVLALTQLFAFFLGMTLITWAAKKQASRIKLLYFSSCLHQEVTWFEAIDSASGSGSSLNGMVDKYEEGIGMKLALLCYFLGHIGLFALTAFYQMFSLAAFCMPFVLLIGIIIAYLSDWQANSIGEHALFAKRSLQLAEEIIAAIRTVFAFNGQQKEITRYSLSLEPVYRKSLIKHLYTALNTSLSKFSIFACFSIYCFYAKHLFPPYSEHANYQNKATILAIMRGAEVSIVNILISIPFLEALQQSKGSIARIFVAIERRSKINVASTRGHKLDGTSSSHALAQQQAAPPTRSKHHTRIAATNTAGSNGAISSNLGGSSRTCSTDWLPSISFRMVQFGYADRSGPTTRRRSTLPFLNLVGPYASGGELQASMTRRRSVIEQIADEAIDSSGASSKPVVASTMITGTGSSGGGGGGGGGSGGGNSSSNSNNNNGTGAGNVSATAITSSERHQRRRSSYSGTSRRQSAVIRQMLGNEIKESRLGSRVLNSFTLDIKPGQSVALVGPSGSGKSTVLALVQRLYEISGGQLLVGQHDIKDLNLAWLRNQIGLVGQEPRLFDMSIAENIMLGLAQDKFDALVMGDSNGGSGGGNNKSNVTTTSSSDEYSRTTTRWLGGKSGSRNERSSGDANQDGPWNETTGDSNERLRRRQEHLMQQVIEASKAANAHEFIVRLPNGYGTRVGSGGVQLSGGQKQRIAIARALIRKPKILLLDECTSALDTDSEAQVHAALKNSALDSSDGPRTTLIVAHRLETIKHVDLIVVMNEGQVVACGKHDELMNLANQSTKGDMNAGARIYKQLYEEQLRAAAKQQKLSGDEDILEEEGEDDDNNDNSGGGGGGCGGFSGPAKQVDTSSGSGDGRGGKLGQRDREQGKAAALNSAGGDSGGLTRSSPNQDLTNDTTSATTTKKGDCTLSEMAGFRPTPRIQVGDNDIKRVAGGTELDDELDDCDDICSSRTSLSTASSSAASERPEIWKLWRFMEIPKWSTAAAVLVCLLAGLILPLNLIAHSYLFSVFAYKELDQIGEYLHVFGLIVLSFSTFVFIVSFLQIILPGYVGEKLSVQLRVKTMDCLLRKPMFYFDMDSNSAGAICDRFNCYISNLQSIAGTRIATILEAVSTLTAGAIFGFGQNFVLSSFCLSFAVLVLITTIIESRIMERESSLQQRYDAQLAHLMADALSNIKTIASLNREAFFVRKFSSILAQRERGIGSSMVCLHTFLTSLKFVMPAMSWSASMYYGSYLLTTDRIDLQTIYIVCPVVLFAVNDTFRALVFLPELLKARSSISRLYKMNREFSPEVLQTLTFGQQLAEQNRLHLEQLMAETGYGGGLNPLLAADHDHESQRSSQRGGGGGDGTSANQLTTELSVGAGSNLSASLQLGDKPKKRSISFVLEPAGSVDGAATPPSALLPPESLHGGSSGGGGGGGCDSVSQGGSESGHRLSTQFNRRLSNIQNLPTYMSMRRKSSRLNSLIPRAQARGRIEFEAVEFAYPNRPTALVMDGFTLSIEPGESVALVGASGSGKSTTVAILEKFYDYHGGSVTLDGRDLRLVEPNWVRSQIGLVQQEPGLLSYTIGDNIRYGDNGRFVSMDEVVEAARTANIHDFIMTLPDQYDTELSSSAYSSCQLSGGQRQRIAIARALVRNAPILIFDEATSALDNKSEQVVQDALRKAKRGRTNLTIAHRLATIMDADKIVVVRDGKVAELGKHDELIAKPDGLYRKLWARQAGSGGGGTGSES